MDVVVGKAIVAVVGLVAFGMVFSFRSRIEAWAEPQADRLVGVAFVLCRIVPFALVYLFAAVEPHSDVPIFYESASHALLGEVVYRDFWSPYSPLFAYLTALPLAIWHSAKAIVLLMVAIEGLALWLTYRYYRPAAGARAQWLALLYLVLPAPLVFCVLGGQEDIWMWAFAAGSLFLWRRYRSDFALGLWWGLALLATKALAVLIVIALFFWVPNRLRYAAGLIAIGVPALALMYGLTGNGFLTPLMFASMPFAPNIWTVLAPVTGDFMQYAGSLSTVGLLAILVFSAIGAWHLRQRQVSYEQSLPILWLLCFGFLMVVHKSSFSNYAFIYMMPLVFVLINWSSKGQLVWLLLLNTLAAVQPSLWYELGAPLYTHPADLLKGLYLLEYGMEVCIVLSVAYFVWLAYQRIPTHPADLAPAQTTNPRQLLI